jgi:hypothetical protein
MTCAPYLLFALRIGRQNVLDRGAITPLQGRANLHEYSVQARGERLLALRCKSVAGHDR